MPIEHNFHPGDIINIAVAPQYHHEMGEKMTAIVIKQLPQTEEDKRLPPEMQQGGFIRIFVNGWGTYDVPREKLSY